MYFGLAKNRNFGALVEMVYIERMQRHAAIVIHGPEHRFTHRDVWIDEVANVIEISYGIARNQYAGHRTIPGTPPRTAQTQGSKGDVYRLKTPVPGTTERGGGESVGLSRADAVQESVRAQE